MRTFAATVAWPLLIGLAMTSCAAEPPVSPSRTHTVVMEGVAYRPASLTVAVGDSVVWVNKDPFPHTATAQAGFDSKEIPVEKSWQYTATSPGEFPYVCSYHPTMKGTLRVTAAGGAAADGR